MNKSEKKKYYKRLSRATFLLLLAIFGVAVTAGFAALAVHKGRQIAASEQERIKRYAVAAIKNMATIESGQELVAYLNTIKSEGVCAGGGFINAAGKPFVFGIQPAKEALTNSEIFSECKLSQIDTPFTGKQRVLIKKFITPETGLLAKAKSNNGTAYLLADKSKLYIQLAGMLQRLKKFWITDMCLAIGLAFIISIFVRIKGNRTAEIKQETPYKEEYAEPISLRQSLQKAEAAAAADYSPAPFETGKAETQAAKTDFAKEKFRLPKDEDIVVTKDTPSPLMYSEPNSDYITVDISAIHRGDIANEKTIWDKAAIQDAISVRERLN